MTGPEQIGEHTALDNARQIVRSRTFTAAHETVDLTNEADQSLVPKQKILGELLDMIVEEVDELENLASPGPLAPIEEQKAYAYRTAEKYGSVDALVRFRNRLMHLPLFSKDIANNNSDTAAAE